MISSQLKRSKIFFPRRKRRNKRNTRKPETDKHASTKWQSKIKKHSKPKTKRI